MPGRSATIQDIARLTGVSTATVSRALSHPDQVAESTRKAVLEAVGKTGYQINHTARNLRLNRTGSILALVPNLANPFFSEILSGMASILVHSGFGLLIADTRAGPDPRAGFKHYLESRMADGLVVLDGGLVDDIPSEDFNPPVIFACEWTGSTLPSVRVDNGAAAAMAVRHLVENGHSAIGHVTGPQGNVLTQTRLEGTRDALFACGLELPREWVFQGDFSLESGARAARRWMELHPRPSAVFCASDQMACGFIGALRHAGIDVPRQVSVVGFDDIEVAEHFVPALTTIRQPRRLIGEQAAKLMIETIEQPGHPPAKELIPVELIRRQSVASPQ